MSEATDRERYRKIISRKLGARTSPDEVKARLKKAVGLVKRYQSKYGNLDASAKAPGATPRPATPAPIKAKPTKGPVAQADPKPKDGLLLLDLD